MKVTGPGYPREADSKALKAVADLKADLEAGNVTIPGGGGGGSTAGDSASIGVNNATTPLGAGTVLIEPVGSPTGSIAFPEGFALWGGVSLDADGLPVAPGEGAWAKGLDWTAPDLNIYIPEGGAMQVDKPVVIMGGVATTYMSTPEAPTPTSPGRRGQIIMPNDGYLYICSDDGFWRRAALETSW